jgi:hypothetical protein
MESLDFNDERRFVFYQDNILGQELNQKEVEKDKDFFEWSTETPDA